MENTRSKLSHSDVFDYLLYFKDGSRKRRRKSRTSGGQSWVHWTFNCPCERTKMFFLFANSLIGFYFYYVFMAYHMYQAFGINHKRFIHCPSEHWGHNMASGMLPDQPNNTKGAKVLYPPHAGEVFEQADASSEPNAHVYRCFPWSRSQPWWSRTAWTWTPCLDIRTGSPPSGARWKHHNTSKLIIPNLHYYQNLIIDQRGSYAYRHWSCESQQCGSNKSTTVVESDYCIYIINRYHLTDLYNF